MKNGDNSGFSVGKLTMSDRWGYIILGLILVAALIIGLKDETMFNERFANEDGFVENLTAVALLCVAVLCAIRFIRHWNDRKWTWLLGTAGFIILFFFAAGEEISWGQRIFGWETSEYFMERNAQSETNIHNLVVGETKLNKLIFSQLLSLAMVLYLIVLPILYRRITWIQKIIDRFAVPVVQWHHTIVFLLVTAVILIIPAERKWEVYELAFGLIFFLIFLNPLNRVVFHKDKSVT